MKKISVLLFVLCAMMWSENSSAQNTITFWKNGMSTVIDNPDSISFKDYFNPLNIGNAATYWKDGQSTVVNEPDSMFIYNFEKVYKDIETEITTEPTELENYLMQLSSDEDSTPFANYSEEDSLRYDSLAQEVIKLFAHEKEQPNNSPKNIKADWIDDDEYAQEAIRENGINRFSSNITIEQQDWDCKDWGNSRYARHDEFKTFYNTFYENGKRTLLVVFYYEGGFPNDKTAYLRVGQVNVGKVKEPINIKAGSVYDFLKIDIDNFLSEHGCVNLFPVIKNKDSKLEKQQYYLNPFFIKTKPIVAEDWNKQFFGYEFGTIDNISVRYNKDSYRDRNLSTDDDATFQCVNLCARYLLGFGCSSPSSGLWGNAKQWPDNRKKEKDDNGVNKYIVFPNNGSEQVREGDIIAWEHGDYGHVAVVIKTTPDYISIAHQNSGSKVIPIGTTLSIIDGIIKDLKYDVKNKRPTNNVSVLGWPITTIIRINCQNEHHVDFKSSMRINTTSITFEDTDINGNSSRMPFTIKNTSPNHSLDISSIEFSKGLAFSTDAVPCTIDPGKNKTFYVTFAPKQRATFEDYLVVKSNADDNPTWRINLSGNGIGEVQHSTIRLIPSSIEFGTVPKGVPESRHFVIQNTGLYDLRFRVEQPSDPFNIPEAGKVITIPAEENHAMEVICNGLEPGEVAENVFVKITSDATNKDEVTGITLSANGGYLPLQLSTIMLSLTMGNQGVVNITSGSGTYSIEKIEPTDVVTASISGNIVNILAVGVGSAVITIKDDISGERATIEVTVRAVPAEPIDLGLPSGTKWASYNVGATAPEEYGGYYAWGEIKEKDVYDESTYKYCKNGSYTYIGDDIGGTEFDVAHVEWEGNWIMPNKWMAKELIEYCTSKWTTRNGVYGTEFTGPNGATIFLPAAGYRKDSQTLFPDVWGDYWCSSLSESNTYSAYELYFKSNLINCDYIYNDNPSYRRSGHTVRPVIPGLFLSSTVPLSILEGGSETITVVYGSGNYDFEVDKEGIVSVNISGSTIIITGNQVGNVIVTVKDSNGSKANISVAVNAHPVIVDLGLPSGTKWASFNIGSNTPEDLGNYYAWGESEVKDVYNESTYEHCKNGVYAKIGDDIRGSEYDTARKKWGGEWMMPSTAQFNELANNCTSKWGTINGVYGRLFTSKINGESIFFPAAGYHGNNVASVGENGFYWSGNIYPDNTVKAYNFNVKNGTPSFSANNLYYGFTIRPVISGLELSTKGSLYVFEGKSGSVTIKSGSGSYRYDVDKDGIVSISIIGSTITINALKVGDVVLTVTDTEGGQKAMITINVRTTPTIVDLGLPSGTKWANINVGANSPEDYGNHYAWGETETKNVYNRSTYQYYKNDSYVDIDYDIRGSEYDVAHVKWGGNWMMPSNTQMNELFDNCTSELTTVNGIYGRKFTSKINGESIFLPAAGFCEDEVFDEGATGYYWSCSSKTPNASGAYSLCIRNSDNSYNMGHYYRYYGFAVRPVIREKNEDDDPRMGEVISEIVIDKLRDHLPIYSGTNPPNIEGSYLITPYTTVFCEDGNWDPGYVISDYKIRFFNQSSTDNTIDMIDHIVNGSSYSQGTGAFISGDDTHFTAYFNTEGFSKDIFTRTSVIVSGTKTADGIKDLYYGFVMEEKGNDPDHKLMDTGVYRIFKDGDGISEPTSWEFESNGTKMMSKNNTKCKTMVDGLESLRDDTTMSIKILRKTPSNK